MAYYCPIQKFRANSAEFNEFKAYYFNKGNRWEYLVFKLGRISQ